MHEYGLNKFNLTIKIDERKIRELIEEKKARRIAFNAPDGLIAITRGLASRLETDYAGLKAILIADQTYGSCDTVDVDAQRLRAEIAFHIGHNVTVPTFGKITYSIDAFDDVKFDEVVKKATATKTMVITGLNQGCDACVI